MTDFPQARLIMTPTPGIDLMDALATSMYDPDKLMHDY